MMNKTEHKMRLCFDQDYAARVEELRYERDVLISVVKSYYKNQHPLFWITILAIFVAFIDTREPFYIGVLILPAVMLVVPIGYGLIQYAMRRRRLGL